MGRLPGAWTSCLWTPPATVGADPCWQAVGLRVGAGQRLLRGPGRPARCQAPALPPAHVCCRASCGAARAVCCPTCRGSSGRVVSAVTGGKEGWPVPRWPQGHPGTHRFCWHYTVLRPRQLPLCPLPGCKRVIRAGRQRCGSGASASGPRPVATCVCVWGEGGQEGRGYLWPHPVRPWMGLGAEDRGLGDWAPT